MAYPFGPMPTLKEFIKVAVEEFGAQLSESGHAVLGPRGASVPRYLERKVEGGFCHVTLPNLSENDILTPPVISYLCQSLQIPSSRFGFILGPSGFTKSQ